ncbi:hypothetical protein [Anditalea andensis]|uniref:HEAT repeat domain-containing protein n=1 Tax=Anditalea andensis TaxID=1048983 RepID=A0A074KY51_9BACT|nr:hypothetical protein [Anditalea andensis]KEO74916.1 hypothetical protein EL17_04350 [Anditalea andensis]
MEFFWNLYQSKVWVVPFLIYAIGILLFGSVTLLAIIIWTRHTHIKEQKFILQYDRLIEPMLLNVLFDTGSYSTFNNDPHYSSLFNNTVFRKQMMANIINLHKNYEGSYAKKLEKFYLESHLITDSFRKLKNARWEIQCLAIEELSEMNVVTVFEHLVDTSKSSNKLLKIAAIKGCIKLNGTKGITHLIRHKDPLDQWSQLSIIDAIKHGDLRLTEGIEILLTSKNDTVVSLGLKIIQSLHLSQHNLDIIRMISTTDNVYLKQEGQLTLTAIKSSNT